MVQTKACMPCGTHMFSENIASIGIAYLYVAKKGAQENKKMWHQIHALSALRNFTHMTNQIFDLKEIGAGAILHQLLLCPCDCHQPIFAYFNLAVIVMMNENAGCDDDVCRWCYLGCRVKWRIPGRTLPPAASFASRHLHFYLSSFSPLLCLC